MSKITQWMAGFIVLIGMIAIGFFLLGYENITDNEVEQKVEDIAPSTRKMKSIVRQKVPEPMVILSSERMKRQQARRVEIRDLPKGLLAEVHRTSIPLFNPPFSLFPKNRQKTPEAANELFREILSSPQVYHRTHSVYEGEDLYLIWGSHENSPQRGFAVRRSDAQPLVWALGNKHVWKTSDNEIVVDEPRMLKGYLYSPEDWATVKAEQDARDKAEGDLYLQKVREYQEKLREREEKATQAKEQSVED